MTGPSPHRTYWTAVDLLAADLPEPRFAVPGVVPEGLSLLVGSPKVGKSWAALGMAIAVASGGRALGSLPVEAGDVLYLALEDGPRRLRDRLRLVLNGEPAPERLAFVTQAPRVDQDLAEFLERWADKVDSPRLVVVDVLAKVRPPTDGRGSLYAADYAAAAPLQTFATSRGLAVLVVHHTRKAKDDDFLATVSGTHGLAGAADAVLVLTRSRTAADAVLAVTGRDLVEAEHALTFDAEIGTWRIVGDAATYATTPERRRVLEVLAEYGSVTPKQLASIIPDLTHDNAKQTLRRMAIAGEVDTDGAGTYLPLSTPVTPVTAVTPRPSSGDTSDKGDTGTGTYPAVQRLAL